MSHQIQIERRPALSGSVKLAIGALLAIVIGLLWLGIADPETFERDKVLAEAGTQLAGITGIAADSVSSQVLMLDGAVKILRREWPGGLDAFSTKVAALKPLAGTALMGVTVVGPDGDPLFSDTINPLAVKNFHAHKTASRDDLLISEPIIDGPLGRPVLQFSRGIQAPDGSFAGVIMLSVAPEALASAHSKLAIHKSFTLAIVGRDGTILSRLPALINGKTWIGATVPPERPFMAEGAALTGSFRGSGIADSAPKLFHWQMLDPLPLVVLTHVRESELLEHFEGHVRTYRLIRGITMGILLLAAIGLLMLIVRYRQTTAQAVLYRSMMEQTFERMTGFQTSGLRPKGSDFRRFARIVIGCAIVLALSLGGLLTKYLVDQHDEDVAVAEAVTVAQAGAHQAFLQRTLHDYDTSLRTIRNVVEGGASPEAIGQFITAQMRANSEIMDLLVLNETGEITAWTRAEQPPNVAERPYFTVHRDRQDDVIHITQPMVSKVHPGQFFFSVSRRISAPDGSFAGTVVLILDIGHFSQSLRQITSAANVDMVITTIDGVTILGGKIGEKAQMPSTIHAVPQTVETASALTGTLQIATWVQVKDYPLIVGATMNKETLLQVHRGQKRTAIFVLLGAILVISTLTALVLHLARSRFAATETLEKERSRMASVIEGTNVGTWEWDIRTGRAWFNERWAAMLGRTLHDLSPATTDTWIPLLHPEDRDRATGLLEQHIFGLSPHYECEMRMRHSDGSWVWILARGRVIDWAEDGTPARMAGIHLDISERKAAEQQARDIHDNLRQLLGCLGEGVYGIDTEGKCTWINPAALSMLGFDEAEVLGSITHDLFHHSRADGSPYPIAECPILHTLTDGQRREAEEWFIRKDGSGFAIDLTVTPVMRDESIIGAVASFHDITQRKEAAAALERNESMLRSIIEGIPGIFYLFDQDGRFLMWNHNMEVVTGRPPEIMAQSTPLDLFGNDDKPLIKDRIGHVLTKGCAEVEAELVSLSGQRTPYLFNGKKIDFGGQPCVVGVGIDISEIKQFEEELRRSNSDLEQFAYVVSHDLRQPLRMINSYVQLLQRNIGQKLNEDEGTFFHFVKDGAGYMDQMLVSLLEYSRVGRKGEPMQQVASRILVDDALTFLKPAIAEAGAEIRISGDWPTILASRNEMVRTFQNLIGNAVKYRSAERTPIIELAVERDGSDWLFTIHDNGIGIAPNQSERLFKVFQRLHTRTKYEGTGIGLAICRKIIERHEGRIWVESKGEDCGSSFRFTLPVLPSA